MKEKEKEISTKEVQTSSDSDLTFTDVQFKLLVLQLQYMRSILRRNKTNVRATPHDSENNHPSSTNDIDNQNKETQTGISLLCEPESSHGIDTQQTAKLRSYSKSLMKDDGLSLLSNANFQENELPYRNAPSSVLKESQQHYHLKFDDVPFILGASSSASHNVVANVQNIIAMMKTHNKVLCGPRFHSRNTTSASTTKNCSQDSNKMLKKLSEELAELQVKQERLKERFDTAQSGSHFSDSKVNTASVISSSQMVKNDIKKPEVYNHKKEGTSSTSSRSNYKCKNREIKQEKHAVPSNRIQENQSQVSRQRLLRSLQDFKTHLTEEDITWD